MSLLRVYPDDQPEQCETLEDFEAIAACLEKLGVHFERWQAAHPLSENSSSETVIAAYQQEVDRLCREHGFQSVDVVSLHPDHPDREALRRKFLDEHTHEDHEVRFFVEGSGQFYLHLADKVYVLLCEQGDLLSVPAGTRHWFDMGERPYFKCIRLFTRPDGWVAQFTGDNIAARFPAMGT